MPPLFKSAIHRSYTHQLTHQAPPLTLRYSTLVYTQATSKCRIQLELETPLGEALVEDNSYSIVKINNNG